MLLAYTGAFVWSITFIALGNDLGERWYLVMEYVHRYSTYLLLACVAIAVGIFIYLNYSKARATS